MLIFLDIDGVLRRDSSPLWQFDEDLLERFAITVDHLPRASIVISSSWREGLSLAEIRGRFPASMAARVIGVTPIAEDRSRDHYRYREVLAFTRYPKHHGRPWVALDDQREHYPVRPNVRILDPAQGFDEGAAAWLLEMGGRQGADRASSDSRGG